MDSGDVDSDRIPLDKHQLQISLSYYILFITTIQQVRYIDITVLMVGSRAKCNGTITSSEVRFSRAGTKPANIISFPIRLGHGYSAVIVVLEKDRNKMPHPDVQYEPFSLKIITQKRSSVYES